MTNATAPREALFFMVMAWIMAIAVAAGFGLNLAMGRSSLSVPLIYHIHAAVFFGWTLLYVVQNSLIYGQQIQLHRRLGKLTALLIPVMLVLAIWLTLVTLRVLGGPPFFGQAEFLFVNIFHILAFAILAGWGVMRRGQTDWHRRLLFGAMACVAAPGLARLLPLPLTVPYTFIIIFIAAMVFPLIGMLADKLWHGKVHPAWWWTLVLPALALVLGEVIASTDWALAFAAAHVEGTPGGLRPPGPFMP
ncbi:hypothetical protein FV139_18400 [Parahaliea maris]|uniref:Uncharacterized protein n=1 Tax=Parahaliea maris TaxID=2716870 RepID=A0A5C8ZRN1_9GAMM|nr:hypothetical protein [Parahaliea maris]TXS90232.1 hypothetical protein FV139_18400 [Parahaliea maris]